MRPLTVIHVVPEVTPFSESGGLGLVAGSLPPALQALGQNVAIITPQYRSIDPDRYEDTGLRFDTQIGPRKSTIGISRGAIGDVPVYLLDCPAAFRRRGLYGHRAARDYADNSWRFMVLVQGALEALPRLGLEPDILHAHDWPTGLLPMVVAQRHGRSIGTVLTIHNLGYHGQFPRDTVSELGLDWSCFHPAGAEFWGDVNFLKAGINYADRITTVSPTYAKEITTKAHGHGLDGVLRGRQEHLVGILNGVDYDAVKPKRTDRRGLIDAFRLGGAADDPTPVLGMVSRLVSQKGIDLIPDGVRALVRAKKLRVAILGTGEAPLEKAMRDLAAEFPGRIGSRIEYNGELARLIMSGSDALLMPSRYEPCGLTQMFALRYGTLPVVRATGGLADTVSDGETGFAFEEATPTALAACLDRMVDAFARKKRWAAMKKAAKQMDFSWSASAEKYAELYEEIATRE